MLKPDSHVARSPEVRKESSKSKNGTKSTKRSVSKKKAKDNHESTSSFESESGDIATLILRDHKPIKELISILKDSDTSFKKKYPAFAEFEGTLTSHAKAEEESLYVHLKEVDDLRINALEGDTEHAIAEQLIKEVNESEGDEDSWMAKVKVLAEVVEHHVKEEEKELLKQVRNTFDSEERQEIGELYSQLLNQYREDERKPKQSAGKYDVGAEYV
ncbi:MAG: hypothetical protein COT74_09705 [Bdellovibrionales bacterium CG10_big_fil_rev_8_21_14_0_10_45_34]|nr:MAG: hypothetical protein COT74_09705 [Bdellovibrionales bacterium CG10_big_fil_rev_8_21_14_0_10_45_34]